MNLCAVREYCIFIDSLSDRSHNNGDRLKRIPMIPLRDDCLVFDAADVWDRRSWLECKRIGDEAFSMRTTYLWGSVGASIYDERMAIDVERS